MRMRSRLAYSVFALIALIAFQTDAQQPIPIRTLTTPVATDSGIFRSITSIRALSDGRVIVNDANRKRLLMFDSTLRSFTTLADTAASAPNRYPMRQAGIFPYFGDSTIFVETEAQALIVVDPSGKFGRVMASPRPSDLTFLAASVYGTPGFDVKGRLVYRGVLRTAMMTELSTIDTRSPTPTALPARPDSAPIVRADFDTRAIDTIGFVRVPMQKRLVVGNMIQTAFNPLPTQDEWTLLPDGTVVIARYDDYHLDVWSPDGSKSSTPKIPFDWKRISIEERHALLDSVRKADEVRRAALPPAAPPATGRGGTAVPRPIYLVDAEEMWEFYPPLRPGQVKADRESNIWILPSTSSAAGNGLVFDVVSKAGVLIERVRLPAGRNLIGFGPGQTVYMIYAPSPERILLERAQIKR
jgi:hypothetical protein